MNNFQEFIANKLNPAQQQAVTTTDGVLLVIAGAGSGKTRVITARIANLILNAQVKPTSILALTFTNKAAQEMQERVAHFLAQAQPDTALNERPFVGTFHAYCLQLLKRHRHLLTLPNFTILDSDDQEKLVNQLLKQHNLQKTLKASTALYYFSQLKNNPTQLQALQTSQREKLLRELLALYEAAKQASQCYDFDDLLLETLKLFALPEFKNAFQRQIRHILIDEYQDTSVVQHTLLRQMALTPEQQLAASSVCIVGDEDQSIYSWRGATVDNIVNFRHEFPTTQVIKIEQNYRSAAPILDLANTVIQHNQQRYPKNLWSTKQAKNRVFKATCLSGQREAELITDLIAHSYQQRQSIAVLYRTHSQSRTIEEALIKQNLAYQIIGGIRFYERKEIKDLLAYLRLLVNPFDRLALERVINCPPRKLGEKFWELVHQAWQAEPYLNCHQLLTKLMQTGDLTPGRVTALTGFLELFTASAATNALTPSTALRHFISNIGYYSYLKDSYEPREAEEKLNNVKELIRAAEYAEMQNANTVANFLEEIA
ncbi:MAG TPA: UvrD-helicase domain-containing protein, partial [Candidatus Babeliales bacterium]|nr:UvrD-helicase domain-containing protein [Candidatus Babeliales bacterium]